MKLLFIGHTHAGAMDRSLHIGTGRFIGLLQRWRKRSVNNSDFGRHWMPHSIGKTYAHLQGVIGILAVAAFVIPSTTIATCAQTFSPYSDFQAISRAQLQTLQVKLTYLGEQAEVVSTVAFTATGNSLRVDLFKPFHRPGFEYSNDSKGVQSFTGSPEELKVMIDLIATLPNVTAGGVASQPYVSFAMLYTAGGKKGFDATLNKADALALFGKLRIAFKNNAAASKKLESMAGALAVLDAHAAGRRKFTADRLGYLAIESRTSGFKTPLSS